MSIVNHPSDKRKVEFLYDRYSELSFCSQNDNTLDKNVVEDIYTRVTKAFGEVSLIKNETIPHERIMCIIFVFIQIFESHGEEFFNEHLAYQANYYLEFGLKKEFNKIDFDY